MRTSGSILVHDKRSVQSESQSNAATTTIADTTHPNWVFRYLWSVDIEKEWLPVHFECWRCLIRTGRHESLHGALEVSLSHEAPRANVVADDLPETNTKKRT